MSAAVPQWLLAKNVTVSAKPYTIAGATGVVTAGTTVSFVGILDEGPAESFQVDKVAISPTDNPNRNKVIVEQGSMLTITELPQAMATSGTADANTGFATNALQALAQSSLHYQITILTKNNAGTTVATEIGDWQLVSLDKTAIKGKNTHKMSLETFSTASAGVYSTNPVFS